MSPTKLKNRWSSIKGQLKQRFAQLTDDDLAFAEGKADELLARLREKLDLSLEELNGLLEELSEAKSTSDKVKAKVSEVSDAIRSKAEDLADDLKDKASEIGEQAFEHARQRTRGLLEEGEEYVRQNPREALVGCLVAGYVVGLVIFRR
jgi:uncharacterized protein YjbJ (UPF0337 family)